MSQSTSIDVHEEILLRRIDGRKANLTSTLEALAHEAKPSVQLEHAKEDVQEKLREVEAGLRADFVSAQEGDPAAIKRLAVALGVSLAALALMGWQVKRMSRKSRQKRSWRKFTRRLYKMGPPGGMDIVVEPISE